MNKQLTAEEEQFWRALNEVLRPNKNDRIESWKEVFNGWTKGELAILNAGRGTGKSYFIQQYQEELLKKLSKDNKMSAVLKVKLSSRYGRFGRK